MLWIGQDSTIHSDLEYNRNAFTVHAKLYHDTLVEGLQINKMGFL